MKNLLAAIDIGDELWLKPGIGIGSSDTYKTTGGIISTVLRNVYILAGVLLFLLLIFGGLGIIMGAGSGDAKKTAQGQQAVTQALIGFVLIFASYWIIQIIEIITGLKILSPVF